MRKRRWSDNDKYLGPFTYSADMYPAWGAVLDSGDDDDSPGCCLRLRGFGRTIILELPAIIKPWRQWVDTSKYSWSTNPAGGYWDEHRNEYGFSISEGFLQVFLGPQTGDSITTKNWCKSLPWTQWRFYRFSLYTPSSEPFWTQYEKDRPHNLSRFEAQRDAEEQCPSVVFEFGDYDGERIQAKTHIEEREWLFGEGWFKWLSWFRKPLVKRSLAIAFNKEVGSRKGSWKGGTLGHSIEVKPGEFPVHSFRRYCAENNLTFVRQV